MICLVATEVFLSLLVKIFSLGMDHFQEVLDLLGHRCVHLDLNLDLSSLNLEWREEPSCILPFKSSTEMVWNHNLHGWLLQKFLLHA